MAISRGSVQHSLVYDFTTFLYSNLNPFILKRPKKSLLNKVEDKFNCYFAPYKTTFFPYARTSLHSIVHSLKIPKGSTVLMTPINIAPMVSVIESLNLNIKFIDINLEDFGPRYELLEDSLAEKPSIFFLTYLFGYVPNLDFISMMCNKYNIPLIEDISQSIGSRYKGKLLGTFGEAAICSTSLTKYVDGYNGGFALTKEFLTKDIKKYSEKLSEPNPKRIKKIILKTFIWNMSLNKYIFSLFTYPLLFLLRKYQRNLFEKVLSGSIIKFKLKKLPSFYFEAISLIQLKTINFHFESLESLIDERNKYVNNLMEAYNELNLKNKKNIFSDIHNNSERKFSYWQFLIRVKDLNKAKKVLFQNGIETGTTNLPNLGELNNTFLENAKILKNEYIYFPMHSFLNKKSYKEILKLLLSNELI